MVTSSLLPSPLPATTPLRPFPQPLQSPKTKTNMARRGRGRGIFFNSPHEDEEEKKNEISYMQPEILPVHIMETVMKERGFNASTLLNIERKTLIKLFLKHISPKYQREYRDNRRGKILKKMRQRREKKIDSDDWKKMVIDSKERSKSSHYSSSKDYSSRDRLKPPPSSNYKSPSKSIDDIVINNHKVRSKDRDSGKDSEKRRHHEDKIDRDVKKMKLSSSSEKRSSDASSSESGKKIKLKRDVSWP